MNASVPFSFFNRKLNPVEGAWILFFISLPLGRPVTSYALALLALAALLFGRKNFSEKFRHGLKLTWPLLLFYMVHLAGLLYTDDFDFAFRDLSVKIPLAAVPLLAVMTGISETAKSKAAFAFSVSCVAVSVFLLMVAAYNYTSGIPDAFFYDTFSFRIHPAYMALMNVMAVAILLFENEKLHFKKKSLPVFCIALLSVTIILMASKSGILSLLMVYFVYVFKTFYRKNKAKTVSGLALVILTAIVFIVVSPVRERIMQSMQVIRQPEKAVTLQESTASRLLAWKTAWHISKDYFPLGTGTGDIKNVTLHYYENSGYQWPLYYRLNAHNQYLHSLAALGLGGVFALTFILLLPLLFLKKGFFMAALFTALASFNFLFESMLEVQNGVMLFVAFYVLLTVFPLQHEQGNMKRN